MTLRKVVVWLYVISVVLLSILLSTSAKASLFKGGDITFSLPQKDFYFKVGENAILPLHIKNTYGREIKGMLTYTITQEINKLGMYLSSSNTQSIPFSVDKGESIKYLNFGTSKNEEELKLKLKFVYNENGDMIVNLSGITIHFVSNEREKQNRSATISASSRRYVAPSSSQTPNPWTQMQQQINQLLNLPNPIQSQQKIQNPQQALQNNEIAQDSSALKKQIEEEIEKQKAMKNAFRNTLSKNKEFQQEFQKLQRQGFNLTSTKLNPQSNNSGSFELELQNSKGEKAFLKGEMKNGRIVRMQKDTPQLRRKILNQLEQNIKFKRYEKELKKEGFVRQNVMFSHEQNKSIVRLEYKNKENETASIKADIINNTIQNVEVEKNEKRHHLSSLKSMIFVLILLSFAILSYFIYKGVMRKQKKQMPIEKKNEKEEKKIDFKAESLALLREAKRLFEQKKYKDAYGKVGQALRLFLSYKHGLNKELTNDEIIEHLKKENKEKEDNKEYKEVKECFDICSLVEFAKYKANKKDFERITSFVEKTIKKDHNN